MNYLPFLAFLAPFAVFWAQSKILITRILSFFWKTKSLPHNESILFYKLLSKYPNFDLDSYNIRRVAVYNKQGKYCRKFIRQSLLKIFLYKNFIPILVTRCNDNTGILSISYFNFTFPFLKLFNKITSQQDIDRRGMSVTHFTIEVLRGKITDNKNWINTSAPMASSSQAPTNTSKTPVLDHIDEISNKIGNLLCKDNISDYSWDQPIKNQDKYIYTRTGAEIKNWIEKWIKAEPNYNKKNIRYYRGLFLQGKPGVGKSALIKKIAEDLKLPLFIVDLPTFNNETFDNKLSEIDYRKGIILFEDLDVHWKGRQNLNKTEFNQAVTFDCFINKLSGANAIKNKVVIATSNEPLEYFDSALVREGRFDSFQVLDNLNIEEKRKMAEIVLEKDFLEIVEAGADDTTSQFENRVVTEYLKRYWDE